MKSKKDLMSNCKATNCKVAVDVKISADFGNHQDQSGYTFQDSHTCLQHETSPWKVEVKPQIQSDGSIRWIVPEQSSVSGQPETPVRV